MYMLQLGIVKLAKLGTNTRLPFLAILVPSAGNTISPVSKTVVARQLGNNTGVYTQDHIWNNSFFRENSNTLPYWDQFIFAHYCWRSTFYIHSNVNSTCVLMGHSCS